VPSYLQELACHKKKEVKDKQMILDVVKDHLIPHILEKTMTKEMFDAPVSLYQSENIKRKMMLLNKLRSIEMTRLDSVTSYLMKIMTIHDQLALIGEKIADAKLMNMALNGFPTSWEPLVKGIFSHDKLPKFERFWDDCIQEEI
jgi:hypothetical protein